MGKPWIEALPNTVRETKRIPIVGRPRRFLIWATSYFLLIVPYWAFLALIKPSLFELDYVFMYIFIIFYTSVLLGLLISVVHYLISWIVQCLFFAKWAFFNHSLIGVNTYRKKHYVKSWLFYLIYLLPFLLTIGLVILASQSFSVVPDFYLMIGFAALFYLTYHGYSLFYLSKHLLKNAHKMVKSDIEWLYFYETPKKS